jgi:hypothetical protein
MDTRICSKCGIEKDISEFRLRNKFTERRQSHCISCGLEMGRSWYERNKDYQKENAKKHGTEYRTVAHEYIWNYLLSHPCSSCGETNPVVLEFHHVRGEKENDITHLVGRGSSLDSLIAEIEKCDILCANCHRILTSKERGWFRSRK